MNKFLFVVISSFILAGCNRLDVHQPKTAIAVKFDTATEIAQTFRSSRAGLNTVSVCLRSPTRNLAPFRFELWEPNPLLLVRSLDFSGGNIDDGDCTKFQFEPVIASMGREYIFKIVSTAANADPLARYTTYIEAFPDDGYLGGSASVDGVSIDVDLHFKTHYYQPLSDVVSESIAQFASRLALDPAFLIPYLLLLLGVIYLWGKKFISRS